MDKFEQLKREFDLLEKSCREFLDPAGATEFEFYIETAMLRIWSSNGRYSEDYAKAVQAISGKSRTPVQITRAMLDSIEPAEMSKIPAFFAKMVAADFEKGTKHTKNFVGDLKSLLAGAAFINGDFTIEESNMLSAELKKLMTYAISQGVKVDYAIGRIRDKVTPLKEDSYVAPDEQAQVSAELMFDALDRLTNAKDNRLAYLRDLFYSHKPAATFTFEAMRFPWLNTSQERAVNDVLRSKDVRTLHGPPGTGKTTTLVEAINETLMRETQVLVCAQSNTAVDWISEKLVDCGIPVLRLGNPTRVNDKMLSFTYEHRFADHPDYPKLWQVRRTIREIRRKRRESGERFHQRLDRLKEVAVELEVRINADIFGQVRVIASTLVGAGNKLLDGQKFGTLFIDEAAQALEAACWIPIRRASRVIFAGDHCQLPPTVKSLEALKGGLGMTLMERIVKNKPECVSLLQVQYRMNDEIMQFSSNYFYHGQMKSAPEVAHRLIHEGDAPILWFDTSTIELGEDEKDNFKEQFIGETFGRVNKGEANLTISLLQIYFQRIGKQRILDDRIDVGIISPYRAQVQYLRRLIKKRNFFKPYRHLISVNTVDGFQGQERDVILISLVRANDTGQIGFLRDLRRMNVAMTRARMKLFILGDAPTLTRHPFYKQLFDYIQEVRQQ